jgi:hypothetical protein
MMMNKLAAYWEKIVLGIVVLLAIIVVVITVTGGAPVPEFSTQPIVTNLGTNDIDLYKVIITRAKSPVPEVLATNYFAHPWLQYCTACKKLQPRWSVTCPECGATVSYKDDSDSDGIPNVWEQQHGLDWTNPEDAAQDHDQDGLTGLDEFKRSSDPQKPGDPNIVLDDWRFVEIYRPIRPLVFKNRPTSGKLQVQYKGRGNFVGENDVIKEGAKPVYKVGALTVKMLPVWNPRINRSNNVDRSELAMTDLLANEEFVIVFGQTNYEKKVVARVMPKGANDETNVTIGTELVLKSVKKNAVVKTMDAEAKTWSCTVGAIEYSGAAER